mmetsp:Transcript_22466/g.48380  ORF Transcript_22466/g.48380 Transcript_22466/m.48380 type:complete len:217 (-) Transcript_22466:500-1150(-)
MRHRRASQGAADELDVGALDVRDHQDPHLGQEVQAQLVVRVAEDALLDEDYVGAALFYLFAHVEDVLPLVAQDAIHGGVVAHDDVVVHVRFRSREAELDQGDLGIIDLTRSSRRLGRSLVEYQPRHELRIVHRPAQLFHHSHVPQVDVDGLTRIRSQYPQHGIHRQRREQVAVLGHHLGRQTRPYGVHERLPVVHVHRLGRPLEQLGALLSGLVKA